MDLDCSLKISIVEFVLQMLPSLMLKLYGMLHRPYHLPQSPPKHSSSTISVGGHGDPPFSGATRISATPMTTPVPHSSEQGDGTYSEIIQSTVQSLSVHVNIPSSQVLQYILGPCICDRHNGNCIIKV